MFKLLQKVQEHTDIPEYLIMIFMKNHFSHKGLFGSLIFLITMVGWDMLSERIFGFWNFLTEMTLVSWVGNVSGFNVFSEVGFFAALIWTVIAIPEMSTLVHFTLYFSFNIYKQQTTNNLRFMQRLLRFL